MIKKIYKFNWLLFLILILITPFMSAAVAVGYISIWNQLEIKILSNLFQNNKFYTLIFLYC